MTTRRINFEEASVVVTGTYNGKPATYTGYHVGDFEVEVNVDYDDVYTDYDICIRTFPTNQECILHLRLDPDENGKYGKIKYTPIEHVVIRRSAFIEATDNTAAALEEARVLVDAPVHAKYRIQPDYMRGNELVVQDWNEPRPVQVEFYWKEEK